MVKHFVLCFVLIASIQGRYIFEKPSLKTLSYSQPAPQQQAPQQYSAPQQPAPAPEQQAPQQYAAPQMQVPQHQAPQQYAAPQMQVPQQQAPQQYSAPQQPAPAPEQQAPQQYAAPQMQVPQQQAPQQYAAPQMQVPQQQAPQQYAAPQMQVPQQQAPAYGYQNSQSNPDLSAGVPALPNNCPVGITEPIHEGQVVTETYCRCPSGTYGIDCSENFNNPCGYGSRQYHPADASLGPHYFIECNWNLPYVFKCPADLVWNQEIETCDWAHTYKSEPYSSYSAPAQPTYSAPAQPAY